MEKALSILANLATIITFVIAWFTLDRVKKIEIRTRIDQSSGKDATSRTEARQEVRGDHNTQVGRDVNV